MCFNRYTDKYKKSTLGKCLLGLCGSYEDGELENCGHVYCEMEEYNEVTAVEQATALVEYVREYYMNLAKEAEERKEDLLARRFDRVWLILQCY